MSFRESHWGRASANPRPAARESCIALLDAHFLAWLEGREDDPAAGRASHREALTALLAASLHDAGVPADLWRCYWYTSQRDAAVVAGQIVRPVLPKQADGDASLVSAMARDLLQLARNRACVHVLIAADDDRLLPALDEAQLHGLQVHLVADESVADLDQLARNDPSWATLLRQADRRVIVRGLAQQAAPSVVLLDDESVDASVHAWWAGVTEAQREELAAMLPRHRGLPQEADRQLLLRLSQQLGRSLEQGERKRMRETARALLEAVQPAEFDQP